MDLDNATPTQQTAAATAAKLVIDTAKANDERSENIAKSAIQNFFNEAQDQKRFLDTARIPFICDDIRQLKNDLSLLNRYVFIGIGIVIVLGVVMPLITKVFIK